MDMQLEMHSGKMVAFDTSHELLYVQSGCSRLSLEVTRRTQSKSPKPNGASIQRSCAEAVPCSKETVLKVMMIFLLKAL